MSNPWTFSGEPATRLQGGSVVLVEGTSFSISSSSGDMEPGALDGLFFQDTRFVSTWRIRLDDEPPQPLAVVPRHPFAATFIARRVPNSGLADSTLLLQRTRYVGNGMREEVSLRNLGQESTAVTLTFELHTDFAHVFEVKESRVKERGFHRVDVDSSTMAFTYELFDVRRGLSVRFPDDTLIVPGVARLDVVVAPGGEWRTAIEFVLSVDGEEVESRYRGDDPEENSVPVTRQRAWERQTPRVHCEDKSVEAVFLQSERDLGALRIDDLNYPNSSIVAAGAPWFMTLFGRDSLITSLMTLHVDPSITIGTLSSLAGAQGVRSDVVTEEQPGRILHEMRRGLAGTGAGSIYYGSIDATPLFVVTLGELYRWGAPPAVIEELLPNADRALEWIEHFGDIDGDGFVEYQRATDKGIVNQGWKDSFDGVSFATGKLAEAPVALCEVQGYVYAAYIARADIAAKRGDIAVADAYVNKADRLKRAFNEQFWMEEEGYFAIGLDRAKRPITSLASNVGHCLWTGIVDPDKAIRLAQYLGGPEMFSGWGIRTLASSMKRYNPISYHNGSVWPHDTAICAAGLAQYGFFDVAERLTTGLLDAAVAFGGRLPELFCGFSRKEFPSPVSYPASCSPQAWASASPFWLLRTTLLGLAPSIPDARVTFTPRVPERYGQLSVENLFVAQSRIAVDAVADAGSVRGLAPEVRIESGRAKG